MSIRELDQSKRVSNNLRPWLMWVGVFYIAGAGIYYFLLPSDEGDAQHASSDSFQAASTKPGATGVVWPGTDAASLNHRIDQPERTSGNYGSDFRRYAPTATESARAVERAQTAVLATQVKSGRDRLQRLKALDAAWQAKSAALLDDDSGRRIASSQHHVTRMIDLLERDQPTVDQIRQWEVQLDALAIPIERATLDNQALLAVTPEHSKQLADLNLVLAGIVTEVEQRQFLLEELLQETASRAPGMATWRSIVDQRRNTQARESAARIAAARQAARDEAEKLQIERLAKLEREVVEAETQAKEAERRAVIAGLTVQAAQADAALKDAEEERAFERDLPQIKVSLGSFITPGYSLRNDKTKGPASLSFLEGQGVLVEGRPGLEALMIIAGYRNDRPLVGLPRYAGGGDYGWPMVPKQPAEKAQALLVRWGPMMVKKGLLAP